MALRDRNHILGISVARSMMQLYHIVVQVCYGTFSEKDDALKCYLVNYIYLCVIIGHHRSLTLSSLVVIIKVSSAGGVGLGIGAHEGCVCSIV